MSSLENGFPDNPLYDLHKKLLAEGEAAKAKLEAEVEHLKEELEHKEHENNE